MLLANSFDAILFLFELNSFQKSFINMNESSEISFIAPLRSDIKLNENLYTTENDLRFTGVRVTKQPELVEIINQIGILAQTSLNVSGENPILDSKMIPEEIRKKLDFIFEFRYSEIPQASTLVKLYKDRIEVLRKGKYAVKL